MHPVIIIASLLSCLMLFLMPGISHAHEESSPATIIVSTGPAWDGFTNMDGTGLYHELLKTAFDDMGIQVEHIYAPSERAYELVRQGKADFMTCHDLPVPGLIPSSHPMYENDFQAFFRKSNVPQWRGAASLVGRDVVWRMGYYSPENFPEGIRYRELVTGEACLGVVILDRADFYIDDLALMKMSIKNNKTPFHLSDFAIRPIGKREYYPLFADTKKGRKTMRLYEEAMDRLRTRKKMKPIFEKWHYELPSFYAAHPR